MENIRDQVIQELYKRYGFIEKNISKFEEIVFHNVQVNKKDYKELLEIGKTKIVKHICKEIKNNGIENIFSNAVEQYSISKAFNLFDTIISEAKISLSADDIDYLCTNEKYSDFYKKIISKNKNYIDEDDYSFVKGNLLKEIIQTVVSFQEEIEIEDIKVGKYESLSDDILRDYYLTISKFKVLTPEEEKELFMRYKNGDEDAKEELINHNLRLVVSVIKKKWNPYNKLSMIDYIQEGNIGLMRAIDKFEPEKGFKFSTYAIWWISQAYGRALADQDSTVRIPVHVVEQVSKVNRFIYKYQKQNDEEPTDEIIMQELNITKEQLEAVKKAKSYNNIDSLDRTIDTGNSRENNETSLHEIIADTSVESTESLIEKTQIRAELDQLLPVLTEKERNVMIVRYGLDGAGRTRTLQETGKVFGLTRERIRQIESKSIRKLELHAKKLEREEQLRKEAYRSKYDYQEVVKGEKSKEEELFNTYSETIKEKSHNQLKLIKINNTNSMATVLCNDCNKEKTLLLKDIINDCFCKECKENRIFSEEMGLKGIILDHEKFNILSVTDDETTIQCKECNSRFILKNTVENKYPECNVCSIRKIENKRITEIKSKLDKLENNKIRILKYNNNKDELLLMCGECYLKWTSPASKILSEPYCPKCKRNNLKKQGAEVMQEYLDSKNKISKLKVLEQNGQKYEIQCETCGNKWITTKYKLINNPICPTCKTKQKEEEFYEKIAALSNGRLEVSNFVNLNKQVNVKCLDCNQEFKMTASKLKNKCECIYCSKQSGYSPAPNQKTIYELVGLPKEIVDEEIGLLALEEKELLEKRNKIKLSKKELQNIYKIVYKIKKNIKNRETKKTPIKLNDRLTTMETLADKYRDLIEKLSEDPRLLNVIDSKLLKAAAVRFGHSPKTIDTLKEMTQMTEREVIRSTEYIINLMQSLMIRTISNDKVVLPNNLEENITKRLADNYRNLIIMLLPEFNNATLEELAMTSLRYGLKDEITSVSGEELSKLYKLPTAKVIEKTDNTLDKMHEYLKRKVFGTNYKGYQYTKKDN